MSVRTSATHLGECRPGDNVSVAGIFYRLSHIADGRWHGARLGVMNREQAESLTHEGVGTFLWKIPLPFLMKDG